eukprot:TRINITY_DN6029_c0_g1_i1.p1 TRINITY_DN6029_c0_g1~~TRINITY_DN6029_c0_g1_i1.p1  ORF type:complete len:104 (+),score=1.66 TRINITY_DN6029_c0_g1_i1:46-357(+)
MYIHALRQMTYCMNNGVDAYETNNIASTIVEKQLVFRLLSHELCRHYPNDPNAHEFKGCPEYVKIIAHNHCKNIRNIEFWNREKKECTKLFKRFFKDTDKWME